MKIDLQNHVFPKEYLELVKSPSSRLALEAHDSRGAAFIVDKSTGTRINPLNHKFYDIEARIRDMDRVGIDVAVFSLPVPGPDGLGAELAPKAARAVNDAIADIVERHHERFRGLASLPLSDIGAALDEIERATRDLGLSGVMLFTNVEGRPIDEQIFHPLYEKAERLGIPIYIHPTTPLIERCIGSDYALPLIYGWPMDTTIAMARIALGGLLERYPGLKLIFAHGGGMTSFYSKRLEAIYKAYSRSLMQTTELEPPTKLLKRLYVDSALYYAPALSCVIEFFGPERVVFGTDYPFGPEEGIWFLRESVSCVESLRACDEVKEMIYHLNAERLLKIASS